MRTQLSLTSFLSKSKNLECKVKLGSVKCRIEDKGKLYVCVEDFMLKGCTGRKLFIRIKLDDKEYIYPLKTTSQRRGLEKFLPVFVKELAVDELNVSQVVISLLLERSGKLEEVTKPIKIIPQRLSIAQSTRHSMSSKGSTDVEDSKAIVMLPSSSKCDHEWVTLYVFSNFRGDTVSRLLYCKKCGLIRREDIP